MISYPTTEKPASDSTRNGYAMLSLQCLLKRIANDSDREALRELHDFRTLFTFGYASGLRLAEYIDALRKSALGRYRGNALLKAYDLTIDKFSRISAIDGEGVDCRKYFSVALKVISKAKPSSVLQADMTLAAVLQRLIYRHFLLSLKEACRNGAMTRYAWKLPNGVITVQMPITLTGRERGSWLAEHVDDPNPRCPGEAHRVQAIIAGHFNGSVFSSFQEDQLPDEALLPCDLPGYYERSLSVEGIAETLAREKAEDCFGEQRPAIQKLGSVKLKELIHRIMNGLSDGNYRDTQMVREFHISKTSFSRFAGSRWQRKVPDLFANLARLLVQNQAYAEAIEEMGLKTQVFEMVGKRIPSGRNQ